MFLAYPFERALSGGTFCPSIGSKQVVGEEVVPRRLRYVPSSQADRFWQVDVHSKIDSIAHLPDSSLKEPPAGGYARLYRAL